MIDDPNALPLADVSDMKELHQVFRTAVNRAPTLVGGVAEDDTERAELVAAYYAIVLRLLHAHHEGEDLLMTPILLDRCPEDADVISRVAAQHERILPALEEVGTLLEAWEQSPTRTATSQLEATLARFGLDLCAHLDAEEKSVVPIAAECMNVAEWAALPGHAFQYFDGDELWLVIGLVREHLSAPHLAAMDAGMPPSVTRMWVEDGEGMYGEFMSELLEG
ncbi:MAG TPA: hemerythrin domain-containing protein [Candidatus Dormibacteraeota bacterium]|nr:hemerythrin domain-containing protein [Candidatus Dormibacteraeota bacterium]